MKRSFIVCMALAVLASCLSSCARVKIEPEPIKIEPIEVKPIHITVDINIKVDRELDDFFSFEDEVEVPADTEAEIEEDDDEPASEEPAEGKGETK